MFAATLRRKSDRIVKMQKVKSLMSSVVALMIISIHFINVSARYVPYSFQQDDPLAISRRQDFDDEDDELDSNASAPYQNQEDNGNTDNRNNGDGYEETEPDGPYEETPREQEGQADLERFFDDHLGASDRDGMDKENLPSNLVPILAVVPTQKEPLSALEQLNNLPSVRTEYLQLPEEKLIITRQITRKTGHQLQSDKPSSTMSRDVASSQRLNSNHTSNDIQLGPMASQTSDQLDAKDSRQRVVATEDDDLNRVYVTSITDGPFKIAALGGFDPEQDFIDASRDLEEPRRESNGRSLARRNKKPKAGRREGSRRASLPSKAKEDEGDMETMFEDASETDEITFDQEDPFQTDLEAEMRHQAFDKVNVFNVDPRANGIGTQKVDRRLLEPKGALYTRVSDSGRQNIDDDDDVDNGKTNLYHRDRRNNEYYDNIQYQQEPLASEHEHRTDPRQSFKNSKGAKEFEDDDEGKWAHDGVEDMEIPTEARQNQVLNRAVKHDKLARQQDPSSTELDGADSPTSREAANDVAQSSNVDENNGDENEPNGRRMPNADYLKEDVDR